MVSEFDKTPSNYNTEEMFKKYLGKTSYYNTLQQNVLKISSFINPDFVLDLGCGIGTTTDEISDYTGCQILGVDKRIKPLVIARQNTNCNYICADFTDVTDILDKNLSRIDLVTMLYSFHHIEDPMSKKSKFLEQLYNNLSSGSYVCIAEGFIDETTLDLDKLWDRRGVEGYASTFWETLEGIDKSSIENSRRIGHFSQEHELEAGENVKDRKGEYLVGRDWLVKEANKIGFNIVISEPCNALGDCIVLLKIPEE